MDATTAKAAETTTQQAEKVKPCCVCKPQKASRDECLLFYGQDSAECKPTIDQYKDCMRNYGFNV